MNRHCKNTKTNLLSFFITPIFENRDNFINFPDAEKMIKIGIVWRKPRRLASML